MGHNAGHIKEILNIDTKSAMSVFEDHIANGRVEERDFLQIIAPEARLLRALNKVNERIDKRQDD